MGGGRCVGWMIGELMMSMCTYDRDADEGRFPGEEGGGGRGEQGEAGVYLGQRH